MGKLMNMVDGREGCWDLFSRVLDGDGEERVRHYII